MASTFSTNSKLELVTTGEKAGLWGTITNTNLQILEQLSTGYLSSAQLASGDLTLTLDQGATSNGKNIYIKLTGTLGANRSITIPDSSERVIIFEDATTRGSSALYTITVKTAHGSVKAKTLIIAGNAYVRGLEDTLQRKIIRVTSTVGVTTALSPTQINSILPGGVPVADCNNILDYFRITDDKRLLFGAGADYLGRETKNKKSLIRNRIINLSVSYTHLTLPTKA